MTIPEKVKHRIIIIIGSKPTVCIYNGIRLRYKQNKALIEAATQLNFKNMPSEKRQSPNVIWFTVSLM